MSGVSISPLRRGDRETAIATLVLAFANDPVERFLYPRPDGYLQHFPELVAAFGGQAFELQTAWQSEGAVALWLPPDVEPQGDAVVTVLTESMDPRRLDDVLAVLDQMDAHHPRYRHWYLPWLGVDPAVQNTGIGGRLLAAGLDVVDAAHLPAYLETPNPRTVPFYERHGFEKVGSAQAGACPPMTLMLRPPR